MRTASQRAIRWAGWAPRSRWLISFCFLPPTSSAHCTGAEFVADGGITLSGASSIGNAAMRTRNHAMGPSDQTGEPAQQHAHLSLVATVARAGCVSEQSSSVGLSFSLEEKL